MSKIIFEQLKERFVINDGVDETLYNDVARYIKKALAISKSKQPEETEIFEIMKTCIKMKIIPNDKEARLDTSKGFKLILNKQGLQKVLDDLGFWIVVNVVAKNDEFSHIIDERGISLTHNHDPFSSSGIDNFKGAYACAYDKETSKIEHIGFITVEEFKKFRDSDRKSFSAWYTWELEFMKNMAVKRMYKYFQGKLLLRYGGDFDAIEDISNERVTQPQHQRSLDEVVKKDIASTSMNTVKNKPKKEIKTDDTSLHPDGMPF